MRRLETSGRADGRGGLSARTVRYVNTILRSALSDAVKHGRLAVNPTDGRHRRARRRPGRRRCRPGRPAERGRFLRWAEARDPDPATGRRLLAATGMRRGEALPLRWRDVNLDPGRLRGRRSLGVVEGKGDGQQLVEGPTKTGQARVVDIDADTVAALRAYRASRASLAPDLLRDAALLLGDLDGAHRHPRAVLPPVRRAGRAGTQGAGEDQLPRIRLHDLRHTHTTLLLAAGEPVKVVSERLGHANATITITVYQHVHPGMGHQVADLFAALLRG
jgi:integrase